jgi:hypothetical protein
MYGGGSVDWPPRKVNAPPRTFAKSQTCPLTCRPFLLLTFLVRFWAFRGKRSSKTPHRYFCKVHVENFPKKIDKTLMSGFPRLWFVLSRFRVFPSHGSSKTLQKTFYKKIVSKSFTKKSKAGCFSVLDCFNHVFGRCGGVKTPPEISHTKI